MSIRQALNSEEMKAAAGGAEDPVIGCTVRWQNAAGSEYACTVSSRKPEPFDPIVSRTVIWQDGSGSTFSNTVKN